MARGHMPGKEKKKGKGAKVHNPKGATYAKMKGAKIG